MARRSCAARSISRPVAAGVMHHKQPAHKAGIRARSTKRIAFP